ncbi:EthD family reductase [Skermania sp. ID1734]|uniref:EthD family reductase n=1 Tax=Skermania sp. ID1734 TaxID=2597516 RepID=UPI00117F89EC|nr:EthD family reductase [Skermania sp. ID1734]TSD99930.1 EthD family reductase [Skermania sp. ID1734]
MGHRVVVCYGEPTDPAAFDEYYQQTHIPIAKQIPGLSEIVWGKCSSLDGSQPPYYAVAHMRFPTAEALQTALASEEMRRAGKDVANFATGGVTMFTQDER